MRGGAPEHRRAYLKLQDPKVPAPGEGKARHPKGGTPTMVQRTLASAAALATRLAAAAADTETVRVSRAADVPQAATTDNADT